MRRLFALLAALGLVISLPVGSLGAQPVATTKLSAAGAAFTAQYGGMCHRLTVTFLYDSYRAVRTEETPPTQETPPTWYAQLTTSLETAADCASEEWTSEWDGNTYGAGFGEGDTYLMDDLTAACAYFDDWSPEEVGGRHFRFWLAWVADGVPMQVVDVSNPSKSVRQEVGAQLAGTVIELDGPAWEYVPGSAGMGLGTYIFAE